ncbi:hypothetical protein C0995_015409 [Termitomyces sp. Mi166|nr:hypothetical protein C0995_015409 [Termitomyces sp. Mi166\
MATTNSGYNPPMFTEELHFDGTNYITFRDRVLLAACSCGAHGYLEGTIPKPGTTKAKADQGKATTTTKTKSSKDEVEENLVIAMREGIPETSAGPTEWHSVAWATLTEAYGTVSDFTAAGAKKRLREAQLTENGDFPEHIKDLCTKWNKAVKKGATISDTAFQSIVVGSLPESWNTIVVSLYTTTSSTQLISGLTVH